MDNHTGGEGENARLIAAAPELFLAIRGILGALDQPITRRLRADHPIFNADILAIEEFAQIALDKIRGNHDR